MNNKLASKLKRKNQSEVWCDIDDDDDGHHRRGSTSATQFCITSTQLSMKRSCAIKLNLKKTIEKKLGYQEMIATNERM